MNAIEQADAAVVEQLGMMESSGMDMEEMGIPSLEQYEGLRDMVTDYTAGSLLMTSWRWTNGAVTNGHSAGLCIGESDPASASFWSCWEFDMVEEGRYSDMPKSYLISGSEWTADSRLSDFEPLAMDSFPALFGGWVCLPPMDI